MAKKIKFIQTDAGITTEDALNAFPTTEVPVNDIVIANCREIISQVEADLITQEDQLKNTQRRFAPTISVKISQFNELMRKASGYDQLNGAIATGAKSE